MLVVRMQVSQNRSAASWLWRKNSPSVPSSSPFSPPPGTPSWRLALWDKALPLLLWSENKSTRQLKAHANFDGFRVYEVYVDIWLGFQQNALCRYSYVKVTSWISGSAELVTQIQENSLCSE